MLAKVSSAQALLQLLSTTPAQNALVAVKSSLRWCSSTTGPASAQEVHQPQPAATGSPAQHGPGSVLQQRYAAMLSAGVLKPDQHQQQLVGQLAQLLQQLQEYSGQVVQYRTTRAAYEERYQQRLAELELLDKLREAEQQQQQQEAAAAAPTTSSSSGGWLRQLVGSITGSGGSSSSQQKELTPAQKARRAAAARHAQARRELGGPSTPPVAPQGLYVYGSVGSGKSLLMDLFYDTARQELQLDHSRRMHFNAAMLELHRRLHHLDVQREQRQLRRKREEEARANAMAAERVSHAQLQSQQTPTAAAVADHPAAAAAAAAESAKQELTDAEEEDQEVWTDAASDQQVSAWFDDAQWQQKEAKAAVLAIRKHLRATRAGRVPVAVLAAANASVMSAAARSFIRAPGPDPNTGWEKGSSSGGRSGERLAALLCFDEMQVGDPFSAAALKALLEALTAEGCVVVTTSNRHPAELPRHGLHEAMFGHFLNTLFSSCRLFELSASTDYRRLSLTTAATQVLQQPLLPAAAVGGSSADVSSSSSNAVDRLYFWPLGPAADAAMHQLWGQHLNSHLNSSLGSSGGNSSSSSRSNPLKLSGTAALHAAAEATSSSSSSSSSSSGSTTVPVMFGRVLEVSKAAAGAAWFDFEDLCGKPLGSADYLALAQHYHTLFLSGVPAMSFANRDKARRFISLVDELYNARVALVCSAALPPDQLFSDGQGETPLLDLEGLQFEGAVEGSKLRTDLLSDGGVAPVIATSREAAEAAALLGGAEEKFAFARAVSRLYEMQSPLFLSARARE